MGFRFRVSGLGLPDTIPKHEMSHQDEGTEIYKPNAQKLQERPRDVGKCVGQLYACVLERMYAVRDIALHQDMCATMCCVMLH